MSVAVPERTRTRAAVGRPSARAAAAPAPRYDDRPRRTHLRSVEPPRRRRSATVPALVAVGIVFAALLALAVMHALLISGQIRLDEMHRGVASETEEIRRLQLRVAELESPERVLDAARSRLGMVQPPEVGYLVSVAVDPGTGEPVRVPAAEPAPPPAPVVDPDADPDPDAGSATTVGPASDPASDPASVDTTDGGADPVDRPSEGERDE